jgi:hypothetical protein
MQDERLKHEALEAHEGKAQSNLSLRVLRGSSFGSVDSAREYKHSGHETQ